LSTNSIQQRYTLQAIERLKLRKQIETLFQTGEAFSVFPLRVVYSLNSLAATEISPVRAGFSIPKKRIKKAVNRNRVRRLLREAWRLQKHALYQSIPEGHQLHCFLIFTGNEKLTFEEAKTAVKKLTDKLIPKLKKQEE
jgi:ribonuclease P protein component